MWFFPPDKDPDYAKRVAAFFEELRIQDQAWFDRVDPDGSFRRRCHDYIQEIVEDIEGRHEP